MFSSVHLSRMGVPAVVIRADIMKEPLQEGAGCSTGSARFLAVDVDKTTSASR